MAPDQPPAAAPWWSTGVVYQIYPRSFFDTNADGIGDLAGVTARLDHVARLGVDAVWLSPFYRSPMADFGYDVSDYCGVDPIFGSLADFDALVAAAHGFGLRVMVDLVPNHTSDQHPWFVESRSSRQSPKRDWYLWADGRLDRPDIDGRPNNWLSVFGGPAWTWDEATGQYYLHSFLSSQPDLNWRNPEVHEAMEHVLRFWLSRGVDGFRIDTANYVMKDSLLRDNPPAPSDGDASIFKAVGEYSTQLHLYDKNRVDEAHVVYRHWRRVVDEYEWAADGTHRPRLLLGEVHLFDWDAWAAYYGDRDDELHMPFNFGLIKAAWTAEEVRETVDACEAALRSRPHAWPNWVLGNHDEHRVATRVGRAQAPVAMMLLLTLRGTPTMYYGDELGMVDVDVPAELAVDPWGLNVPGFGLGRDPERTPMQWDGSPNAGFCPAVVQPWLPVAPDHRTVNVEVQSRDERSLLARTRALLRLRRTQPALQRGSYRSVDAGPPGVFVYERAWEGERFLVALNFTQDARTVALPGLRGEVAVSTALRGTGTPVAGGVTLGPDEAVVVQLASPHGGDVVTR